MTTPSAAAGRSSTERSGGKGEYQPPSGRGTSSSQGMGLHEVKAAGKECLGDREVGIQGPPCSARGRGRQGHRRRPAQGPSGAACLPPSDAGYANQDAMSHVRVSGLTSPGVGPDATPRRIRLARSEALTLHN